MRRLLRRAIVLATLPAVTACFAYVPADLASVPMGQTVRVVLEPGAERELPAGVPAGRPYVTGTLSGRAADSVMVRVPVRSGVNGFERFEIEQDVSLPAARIVEIQRRELDATRTALVTVGAVAAVTGILLLILDATGSVPRAPGVELDHAWIP